MKILHITASYKPAYIYGGPIYSVAALCEALVERVCSPQSAVKEVLNKEQGAKSKDKLSAVGSPQSAGLRSKEERLNASTVDGSQTVVLEVITTLANGKEELPYPSGEQKIVEGVPVRYFKRWTKDHSHFSPALLFWLWKNAKSYEVIHIHSWWNLVSMGSVVICLLRGIKPIVSPRGMLGDYTFSKGKRVFHQLLGIRLLSACHFHATTLMEAKEIAASLGGDYSKVEIVDLMEKSEVGSPGSAVRSRQSEGGSPGSDYDEVRGKSKAGRQQPAYLDGKIESAIGSRQSKSKAVRIYVIHNIVNFPAVLPQKTRVFDGTLKLIFLSRIHPKKGIELLLDALAEVSFPFCLTIVGEGEEGYVENLKLKAESLRLKAMINWYGAVYGDDKFKLLAAHDLFVLPSYNENFANVVMESLAIGTPVLISDKVGLCEWVNANHYGLVHHQTVEALKNELYHFHKNQLAIKPLLKDFSSLRDKYQLMYHA
ncbi:glycosyltransferase [Pedobacter cryophilus]|uniref:Glycosyltransferase n=1 Tax=Pedobacter cryophilus TaxID=2571271 RepID=A0A4U1BZG6_9SPHI|nr:glycosyltransferase [Pedobacter cryophilus]TKB98612.1 glycosyltransferase [Pedobacter cryophilus]